LELICVLISGFELLLHPITLTDIHTNIHIHTHTHTNTHTHTHRHLLGNICMRDRPLAKHNFH